MVRKAPRTKTEVFYQKKAVVEWAEKNLVETTTTTSGMKADELHYEIVTGIPQGHKIPNTTIGEALSEAGYVKRNSTCYRTGYKGLIWKVVMREDEAGHPPVVPILENWLDKNIHTVL